MAGVMAVWNAGRMDPLFGMQNQYASREAYWTAQENERRAQIAKRRMYYEGTQYDAKNQECIDDIASGTGDWGGGGEKDLARALMLWKKELPEHLRLHEYSTQIAESIDFIAGRLSKSFSIEVENATEKTVVDKALSASPELAGADEDGKYNVVNVHREAIKLSDVPVLLRWDPLNGTCWPQFWNSDTVEMRFADNRPDELEKVIVHQQDWLPDENGKDQPVLLRREWTVRSRNMAPVPDDVSLEQRLQVLDPATFRMECAEDVYLVAAPDGSASENDELLRTIWWGVPFLPWALLRGQKKSLLATRGESVISDQAMKTADRYNAVEQVSWLIARYNSHGNLAVVGDSATLMKQKAERLEKDVADVLLLPGGTNLVTLSLPTDPQMIEHQRAVLKESLYGAMGLAQIDQIALQGLNGVTGYALEILNEKSGLTFDQIRSQLTVDWKRLLNLILDCTAYWDGSAFDHLTAEDLDVPTPADLVRAYDAITPSVVFGTRKFSVEMGSGYIVDDVKTREDYTAGLISQQEALRQRGKTDTEIKLILEEQAAAAQAKADLQVQQQTAIFAGTTVDAGTFGGKPKAAGTSAGKATNTATRKAS